MITYTYYIIVLVFVFVYIIYFFEIDRKSCRIVRTSIKTERYDVYFVLLQNTTFPFYKFEKKKFGKKWKRKRRRRGDTLLWKGHRCKKDSVGFWLQFGCNNKSLVISHYIFEKTIILSEVHQLIRICID